MNVYVRRDRENADGSGVTARTEELVYGRVRADFDEQGNLLGVLVLGSSDVEIDGQSATLSPVPVALPVQFPPRAGEDNVLVERVIDGDTVEIAYLVPDVARLRGIDAPELGGSTKAAGQAARSHLGELLPPGTVCRGRFHGKDKYGRALVDLFLPTGEDVARRMVDAGHAVLYDGRAAKTGG